MTAEEYIIQYPCRSSNLHDYGEYFSHFLSTYSPVSDFAYLVELTQFEWICHTLAFAADAPQNNFTNLTEISIEQYPKLYFSLPPASHLMRCHYPLLRIIDLCQGKIDGTIDINEGGLNLLILRKQWDLSLIPLDNEDYLFLCAIKDSKNLNEALNIILKLHPEFKLDEKLPFWIEQDIIINFKSF